MRFRFFRIPVDGGVAEDELDRFLSTHSLAQVDRKLVESGQESFWAICVTWTDRAGRAAPPGGSSRPPGTIDYREVLTPEQFAIFSKLRALRKALSEESGTPIYNIFSNENLADMVRRRVTDKADLARLHGIGEAKIERFGEAFLAELRLAFPAGGASPAATTDRPGKETADAPPDPNRPG